MSKNLTKKSHLVAHQIMDKREINDGRIKLSHQQNAGWLYLKIEKNTSMNLLGRSKKMRMTIKF